MNRFAVLNCVSRAEPISPAVNRLVQRFEQKMVKAPKKKIKYRGTSRKAPGGWGFYLG